MKKDVVMYEKGSFVDFQGLEHPFIVCALSTSSFNNDESKVYIVTYDNNDYAQGDLECPRGLFIGVAVCNPGNGKDKLGDAWDEEKGKMIALAKARGFKPTAPEKSAALFTTRAGMISEPLVKALLAREVEHIKEDPECVIKGYNQMKARWEMKQELEKYLEETPENLLELGNKLSTLKESEIERVINVALIKASNE